jgi:hypothetical protein
MILVERRLGLHIDLVVFVRFRIIDGLILRQTLLGAEHQQDAHCEQANFQAQMTTEADLTSALPIVNVTIIARANHLLASDDNLSIRGAGVVPP